MLQMSRNTRQKHNVMAASMHRLGYFAVLCLFVDWLLWTGLVKGLGFMLPTFKEQFMAQTWLIGWMIAIIVGGINLAGIFAAPLGSIFGTRAVVMWSGATAGGSLIVASFASSIGQITILLALGLGTGLSFANILTRVEIARYFESNYATANGIGQAGSPLGLILIAPLVQLFLDTYGWRSAFLFMGGISLHLVVCGALLRQPSTDQSPVSYQLASSCEYEEKTKSRKNVLKQNWIEVKSRFGISVCSQLPFWITATFYACNMLVDSFWFIYYVDHIVVKGFTANDAVVFTTAAGPANLISKILAGILIDKGVVKLRPAMAILVTVSIICLLTDPWMNSYWLALVNVCVFIGCKGALSSLNDVYTRELIGTELLASAFSWMELVTGILLLAVGFIPGLINDAIGDYDVVFISMGCFFVLPLVVLLVENIFTKRNS